MNGGDGRHDDRSPRGPDATPPDRSAERAGTDVVEVVVTGPDTDGFRSMLGDLVTERLAACCQLTAGVTSTYWWEGQVEQGTEVRAHLHTVGAALGSLQARLSDLHPYDVPCILVLAVQDGEPDYLDWVRSETRVRAAAGGGGADDRGATTGGGAASGGPRGGTAR